MVIAIDFDNTIVKTVVNDVDVKIKRLKFLAKTVINNLYDSGHIIIINTLRENGKKPNPKILTEAKKYLKEKGIKYHLINKNYKKNINKWYDSRKIACDISIDDRNIIPLVSWPIIYVIIKIKIWLRKMN